MAGIDNNTLLYLRGDSFTDLSLNPKSIVNHGATLDTNSNVIDLNNGGVSTPYTSDFKLQEFTYEGWFKVNNGSTFLFCIGGQSGYYFGDVEVNVNDNGELLVSFSNLNNSQGTQSKNPSFKSDNMNTPNVWMYLAMVYKNKSMNIFINGKKALTYENITLNYRGSSYFVSIGYRLSETVTKRKGYCKNIRISNVARYTENFTPPTQSFNSITINKTNQTDTNIEFNIEKLGQETINKVEVLVNGIVSETYTDSYDNINYLIDTELCIIGNNNITIRVTYDDTYTEELLLTHKIDIDKLPLETPLLDTVERVKLLTELKQTEKNMLSNILANKNVEVTEEDKMSDLIGKVDLLGDVPPPSLYLYKDGDEFINVTGGWHYYIINSKYATESFAKESNRLKIYIDNSTSADGGVSRYYNLSLIDLSEYSKVKATVEVYNNRNKAMEISLHIVEDFKNTKGVASHIISNDYNVNGSLDSGIYNFEIDISSIKGKYYICPQLGLANGASTLYIYKIWLEK